MAKKAKEEVIATCEHRWMKTAWKEFGNLYLVYELTCSKCLATHYLEANPKTRSPVII